MRIIMGNDEFILYFRKQYPHSTLPNDTLGKVIWQKVMQLDPNAEKVREDQECYWGNQGEFVHETRLPKTAAQLGFDRSKLSAVYDYLDEIGNRVDS